MVAFPALKVEVAFAANPNDTSPVWTDISSYVQAFQTRRGRATELDQFQPGTCTVKLDNQDRRFDPAYPAGPYAPNVLLGKRVRISAQYPIGPNLIPNSGFEADATDYGGTVATLLRSTAGGAAFGSYALRVTTTNVAFSGPYYLPTIRSTTAVTVGATYTFSAYVRLAIAGSKTLIAGISWRNVSDVEVSATSSSAVTVNTTNWSQRLTVSGAAPATAVYAILFVYTNTIEGIFDFYTDAWQFERASSATAYIDSVTYRIFDGYIDAWPQTWTSRVAASTPVRATDAFKRFQQFPLNGSYSSVISGNAPWVYFPFNGVLTDSSGNGNNGTWTGSNPTAYNFFSPLQLTANGSKYFGFNDYTAFGTTGWAIGSGLTIETWLCTSGWAANDSLDHGIFQSSATWTNAANQLVILKTNGNNMHFRIVSPGAVQQDLAVPVSFAANTWKHLCWTASATDGIKFYLDGVLTGTPTFVGTLSLPTSGPSAPRWGIGFDVFINSAFLAQTAHFTQPLSADQVYDRYRSTLCNFPSESSTARIGRTLDVMAWPSARRDLDGGAATLALGAANEQMLSYLQKVNNSEVGRLFMGGNGDVRFIGRDASVSPPYTDSLATFGDDPTASDLPYSDIVLSYDDARTWNEIRLQRIGGQLQIARDATLQTTDLVRTFADATLLHSTDAQTLAAAQYRLNTYKNPSLRIEQMTIQPPKAPTTLWPHALGREIGERVTVSRQPQRISPAISQQCVIEGVQHDFDASGTWQTTYNLSRADDTTYWLLGTAGFSELDTTTRLSF